jgi:hypothetical protein
MKRALIAAAVLSLSFAGQAVAAEGGQPPNAQGATFEQRQANILKMLDARIAEIQEGKACVQAAKNDEELKACREKQMKKMEDRRGEMGGQRGQGGMMGGQRGGMGGAPGY